MQKDIQQDLKDFVATDRNNINILAAKMWVSTRTIFRWVSGESSPGRVVEFRLRKILNGYKATTGGF